MDAGGRLPVAEQDPIDLRPFEERQAGAEGEESIVIGHLSESAPTVAGPISTSESAVVSAPGAPASATPAPVTPEPPRRVVIGDYDFGEVIRTMESSVEPLAGQLSSSFEAFALDIEDAVALMEAGRTESSYSLGALD